MYRREVVEAYEYSRAVAMCSWCLFHELCIFSMCEHLPSRRSSRRQADDKSFLRPRVVGSTCAGHAQMIT